MIKGPKDAILRIRARVDAQSGKPDTHAVRPCVDCGAYGIAIHDDANDLVSCTRCGLVTGPRGSTLRVFRDREQEDGTFECECTQDVEDEITAARVKLDKDRTEDERELAAVEITNPEPVEATK